MIDLLEYSEKFATMYDAGSNLVCRGNAKNLRCAERKSWPDQFGIQFDQLSSWEIRESLPIELKGGSLTLN